MRLLKLHGSVNWYEEEGSENLYRLERGYSLPSHEYRLTHGERALRPLMIIPTLEKAILKRPYAGLLTQFSDGLKEIDVLVVIGNSLRDDNLRNTISERASDLDVILINPAAANQTNIVRHPENTHALSIGIEEFIGVGLDTFARLLDKLDALPPGDAMERQNLIKSVVAEVSAAAEQAASLSDLVRDQIARIGNTDVDVRLDAIKSVTAPAHRVITELLRNVVTSQGDESVRLAAIDALADVEGPTAAEVFARVACEPGPSLSAPRQHLLSNRSRAMGLRRMSIAASKGRLPPRCLWHCFSDRESHSVARIVPLLIEVAIRSPMRSGIAHRIPYRSRLRSGTRRQCGIRSRAAPRGGG